LEQAQRRGDLTKSAEIQYGILDLRGSWLPSKNIPPSQPGRNSLLRQEVTDETSRRSSLS
jgi:hypothetical protein